MTSLSTPREQLLGAFSQLDKKTKGAFERLTHVKNHGGTFGEARAALRDVFIELKREELLAFGDPIERVIHDELKRTLLNGLVRALCDKPTGDAYKAARKAIGEDSTPGSTMVAEQFAEEIFDLIFRSGAWATLGVIPLKGKTTKFATLTADPVGSFILTEGGTLSDDANIAGTSTSPDAEMIGVLLKVSIALMDDAEADVSRVVLEGFQRGLNKRLDTAAFIGDGTADATNGGMTGLFVNGTSFTAANGNTTIEKLDFEDFVNCMLACDSPAIEHGAAWWISPTNMLRLFFIRDASGKPVFNTPTEQPGRGIASICGFPVNLVGVAPSTNAAASKVAAFGAPRAQAVGIRTWFNFEQSGHVEWNSVQRSLRAYGRARTVTRQATGFAVLKTAAA